jgi:hypothetical protein
LRDAPRNREFEVESTSVARYARAEELLTGALTIQRLVEILRDRRLPGGEFAGNGHRSSLNADIATHGVAMDLTAGIFWAGAPPHLLGKFVPFDVNDFAREVPAETVSADPVLPKFGDYEKSRKNLLAGRQALKRGDAATALLLATDAESLNPGFYENATLRGRALLALGRTNEARQAFSIALAGKPAFAQERRELEALIHAAR